MAARHPLRSPIVFLSRLASNALLVALGLCLTGLANFLTRLVPGGEEQTEQVTEAEIRTLVNVGRTGYH